MSQEVKDKNTSFISKNISLNCLKLIAKSQENKIETEASKLLLII